MLCRGLERSDAVGPLSDAHERLVYQEPPAGPEEELLMVVVVLLVPSPLVLQVVEAHPADRTQQQGGHIQDRMGGRDTDSQQEAGAFLQQLLLHVVALLPRQKDQAPLRRVRVLVEVPVLHLPARQVALGETVGGELLPVPFHQGRWQWQCWGHHHWQLRYPPKQPH